MEGFKEFQGRTLDDAISEACSYFDAVRERLEIDIVQDSKSGIFGLVGARKAMVRARRAPSRSAMDDIMERGRGPEKEEESTPPLLEKESTSGNVEISAPPVSPVLPASSSSAPPAQGEQACACQNREKRDKPATVCESAVPYNAAVTENVHAEAAPAPRSEKLSARPPRAEEGQGRGRRPARRNTEDAAERAERPERGERPERAPRADRLVRLDKPEPEDTEDGEDLQRVPFEELDQERLRVLSLEAVGRLVAPIVGEMPMEVHLEDGRVCVRLDCGDDSGLLIGREGQTLAALQYLASRLVSRGMNAAVRVQLDAGEYRLRQDEKLREIALVLAEKVRATGKAHSTRPLSSYHRRIVHVTLQDAPDVQTRSSGEGVLKRVIIQRKRN